MNNSEPSGTSETKPLEDMYNLGLTHAADTVNMAKGMGGASDLILNALIIAINSLKQPQSNVATP